MYEGDRSKKLNLNHGFHCRQRWITDLRFDEFQSIIGQTILYRLHLPILHSILQKVLLWNRYNDRPIRPYYRNKTLH